MPCVHKTGFKATEMWCYGEFISLGVNVTGSPISELWGLNPSVFFCRMLGWASMVAQW